jgi:hypothetical protein
MVCILPEGHELTQLRTIRPRDLDGEPLISFGTDTYLGRLLDDWFRQDGTARQVAVEVAMALEAMALVERGVGVALVDGLMRARGGDVVWRPFRPRIQLSVNLITSQSHPLSRPARDFVAHVAKAVESEQRAAPGTAIARRA